MILAGVMSVTLLVAGAQPSLGQSDSGQPPADVPDGMEWDPQVGFRADVLWIDAQEIARQTGADPTVVLARLVAQARMEDIIGPVRQSYPTFVDIYWTDHGVTAQFIGDAPDGAIDLLATAGAPVAVESVRFTARELEGFAAHVSIILAQAGCGDCITGVDPRDQRIVATVGSDVGADIDSVRAQVARSLPGVDVSIAVAPSPVSRDFADR